MSTPQTRICTRGTSGNPQSAVEPKCVRCGRTVHWGERYWISSTGGRARGKVFCSETCANTNGTQEEPTKPIQSELHVIAEALREYVALQKQAFDFLKEPRFPPQPIRIFSKHTRHRARGACSPEQALEAHELARRIVAEVRKLEPDPKAIVKVALMIRDVYFQEHPEKKRGQTS